MTTVAAVSIAVTTALLLALCHGDPKRRRATRGAGGAGGGHGAPSRRLLVVAACLPGLLCLTDGLAAFLMWLGGAGVAGWLVTLGYGTRGRRA